MSALSFNAIQYNKQYILHQISDNNCHSEVHYKSKSYTSIYTLYAFVNRYVSNLFLKTARERAAFIVTMINPQFPKQPEPTLPPP